jgi:hypothetical protein
VASELRVELRWWQRLVLLRMLEHDAQGDLLWTYVINSTPRRAGKSVLVRALALFRMAHPDLFGEQQTVLFTGKDLPICKEIHSSAWTWAATRGWKVSRGMGIEAIEAPDGSRWLVRSQGGVYGYPAGLALCDEAWKVPDAVIREGLQPSLMERANPQMLITSTAHTRATALMRRRIAQARSQLDDPSDTLLLLWAAPGDADPSDPAAWRDASPHWDAGRATLTADAWRDVLSGEAVPDPDEPDLLEGFRAQYLNVWPDMSVNRATGLVDDQVWQAARTPGTGAVAGVGVEAERGQAPVVAVVRRDGRGRLVVGVVQAASVADAGRIAGELGVPPQVGASLLHDPVWAELEGVKCQGTARDLGGVFRQLVADGVLFHDGGALLDRMVRQWDDRPGGRADAVKATVWAVKAARTQAETPAVW